MTEKRQPFHVVNTLRNGIFILGAVVIALSVEPLRVVEAGDRDMEALELRRSAEQAIAQERVNGHAALADAMEELLPELLGEVLADASSQGEESVDTHDQAMRRQLLELADHLDAKDKAIDRFTLFVKTEGVRLTLTPSENLSLITDNTTLSVDPGSGSGTASVTSPGSSNNDTVGFSGSPGNSGGGPPSGKGKP